MLEVLIPQGPYEEIAATLHRWYAGMADAITFPTPEDPADDPMAAAAIERLHSDVAKTPPESS
jgi:hypothetical protein